MIDRNSSRRFLPHVLVVGALALGPTISAADDDTGLFLDAAWNRIDTNFRDANDVDFDESDDTWSARLGYMFNNNWGIQVGYLDLGDYQVDGGFSLDAEAIELSGLGKFDLGENFSLYGKAGVYFLESSSQQVIPGRGPVKDDQDETQGFVGLGAVYDFGSVGLFAEYSWVDTEINDLTLDIISAGVKYQFGY